MKHSHHRFHGCSIFLDCSKYVLSCINHAVLWIGIFLSNKPPHFFSFSAA